MWESRKNTLSFSGKDKWNSLKNILSSRFRIILIEEGKGFGEVCSGFTIAIAVCWIETFPFTKVEYTISTRSIYYFGSTFFHYNSYMAWPSNSWTNWNTQAF